jgi:K+ transporter
MITKRVNGKFPRPNYYRLELLNAAFFLKVQKFSHGGYVTIIIAVVLIGHVSLWFRQNHAKAIPNATITIKVALK